MLHYFNRISWHRALATGRFSRLLRWVVAAVLVLPFVIYGIGFLINLLFGDWLQAASSHSTLLTTIETYLDPSNKPMDEQNYARRYYFLIVGMAGIFLFNGLLVSVLVSWFEGLRDRWEHGLLHYKKRHLGNYSVILGGNDMVPDLVMQLLTTKTATIPDHVIVMTRGDVPELRKRLVSTLGKAEEKVVIYSGDLTSESDLDLLHPREIDGEIFVIGEDLDIGQNSSHHDVQNMDCVQKLAHALDGIAQRKTCRVMFEYQSTFAVFQIADVNSSISKVLDFKPFNYYETWAQKVWVCKSLNPAQSDYLPLEGAKPITAESDDTVHLVVVGMSRMGMALGIEAAFLAHYPNFIKKRKRTRITFIDSDAKRQMHFMQGRYKELFSVSTWRYIEAPDSELCYACPDMDATPWRNPLTDKDSTSPYKDTKGYTLGRDFTDIDWQFIQGHLEMPSVQRFIKQEATKPHSRLTIAICFPEDNGSLAASLYLPDEVYEEGSSVQQVLIYQPNGDAMRRSFEDSSDDLNKSFRLFSKLRAFGMIDSCYSVESQLLMEKMMAAYRVEYNSEAERQQADSKTQNAEPKKGTQKNGKSPTARQWSSFYSASHMWTKLRSAGYDGQSDSLEQEDEQCLALVEHIRWNMEQLLMGFAPLKPEEQKALMACQRKGNNEFKEYRNKLKANMTHPDILSQKELERIDFAAVAYDEVLVKALPVIYKRINMQ